jgi:pimeloyl-ACP methyl ester carboxylesterase
LVVLVPPLLMPSVGLVPLKTRLDWAGHETRLFRYPSYRHDIPSNATRLARYLNTLGQENLDVVTFSMGGILLRWAVNHCEPIPTLRRVVMIGPPNQGAWLGSRLDKALGPLYPMVVGAAAKQLRSGSHGLCAGAGLLPKETELGIIAGGRNNSTGYNFFIPGDNDRIITPEETKLEGMNDWILIRAAHGPMIFGAETADLVRRFLATGSFARDHASRPSRSPRPREAGSMG